MWHRWLQWVVCLVYGHQPQRRFRLIRLSSGDLVTDGDARECMFCEKELS